MCGGRSNGLTVYTVYIGRAAGVSFEQAWEKYMQLEDLITFKYPPFTRALGAKLTNSALSRCNSFASEESGYRFNKGEHLLLEHESAVYHYGKRTHIRLISLMNDTFFFF